MFIQSQAIITSEINKGVSRRSIHLVHILYFDELCYDVLTYIMF
jgi:hypothetical protein